MEDYYGLVEFFIAVLFIGAWAILEWQGRRLDRAKALRDSAESPKPDVARDEQRGSP